ncbi:MAG: hypothetical protein VW475_14155, partial [Curvibacter sp.]
TDLADRAIEKDVDEIEWDLEEIEKGDFDTFMLKEIHEQPRSIVRGLRGRAEKEYGDAHLGGLNLDRRSFFDIRRVCLVACGSSLHAALAASYLLEELAREAPEVEIEGEPGNPEAGRLVVHYQKLEQLDELAKKLSKR